MAEPYGLIRILTDSEMQRIHDAALHILHKVGMRVDHEGVLAAVEAQGCEVNRHHKLVRFPESVIVRSLQRMRGYMLDTSAFPPTHEPRTGADFGVRVSGFCTMVRALDDKRREASLDDICQAIRLADGLPYIRHVGLPISAQEIPPQVRTVHMAAQLVKITTKPGTVEAWTPEEVRWLWEMAVIVCGSEDAARSRPILVGYVGLRTPLCFDRAMAEVLVEYSRLGIPYMLYSMPCWGSTAPATSAGVLALGMAEVLAGVTIGQAIYEHSRPLPFIAPGVLDMRSMVFDVASPLRLNLSVAATQMISQFYGLPCAVNCGKTAACMSNVQAGYEKALSILYPVLAGATSIGPIGQLESGFVFSFRQLVIDHEIVSFIKRLLRGIEVTATTLALEAIEAAGPGGDFLVSPHTAANFRHELWVSDIGENLSYEAWLREGKRGIEEKALEKARHILATHYPHPLSREQENAVDAIVAAAWRSRLGTTPQS